MAASQAPGDLLQAQLRALLLERPPLLEHPIAEPGELQAKSRDPQLDAQAQGSRGDGAQGASCGFFAADAEGGGGAVDVPTFGSSSGGGSSARFSPLFNAAADGFYGGDDGSEGSSFGGATRVPALIEQLVRLCGGVCVWWVV